MADQIHIPEMARLLNTTDAALRAKIQRKGDIPTFKKLGSRIVWTRESYREWLTLKQPPETINEPTSRY